VLGVVDVGSGRDRGELAGRAGECVGGVEWRSHVWRCIL
jgi:hypothetical protein